jgi:uncharacterized protein
MTTDSTDLRGSTATKSVHIRRIRRNACSLENVVVHNGGNDLLKTPGVPARPCALMIPTAISRSVLVLLAVCVGCDRLPWGKSTWHGKFDWRAEKYFRDPQVVALCHAIEANDLTEMQRLIDRGANVNARGKGNMTPLLWAFPDNCPERFRLLLHAGANPNVIVESDFGTRNLGIQPGDSVTHMTAKSAFPQQFRDVMDHGGDPNLRNPRTNETVLGLLIRTANRERIRLLLDKGADLNLLSGSSPPVIEAISWFGQYDLALEPLTMIITT